MKYIRRLPEQPRFYASYGSFLHKLLAQYYKGELTREELQIQFLFDFQDEVQGERPSETVLRNYIAAGSSYLKDGEFPPIRPLAVEEKLVSQLGDRPFLGFVDLLGERDGKLILVDHKSRNLKPRKAGKQRKSDAELDEMLRQLYLYAAMVFERYGQCPDELWFNCFREKMLICEPFSVEKCEEAKHWALHSIEEIENETEFPPNREFFRCKYLCGLSDECCYWKLK